MKWPRQKVSNQKFALLDGLRHKSRHLGNGYPAPTNALQTSASWLAKKIKHSHPRSPCGLPIVAKSAEFGALRQAAHVEAMSGVGIKDRL
jgi:hypothetical protein